MTHSEEKNIIMKAWNDWKYVHTSLYKHSFKNIRLSGKEPVQA